MEILQNIIFPDTEKLADHYGLFYRGERRTLVQGSDGRTNMLIPKSCFVGMNTYFNGFSFRKWKKYTGIGAVTLRLEAEGQFRLSLTGYSLDSRTPVKEVYHTEVFDLKSKSMIEYTYPEIDSWMLAFEIEATDDCVLYGGSYCCNEFPESRNINLAISTTTCKKEKFITSNVKMIKESILDSGEETSDHLYIHIVDNGGTLSATDFPDDPRIFFHTNNNTGGAGGFARGMIECLHQKEGITHILLMDDDVMVGPESFVKVYHLLKHLKPEYQSDFISGAMFYMENPIMQKEDVGSVGKDNYFHTLKWEMNQVDLFNNLKNEDDFPLLPNCYSAWWFCCIPMDTVREKGLPLPVFVRGDDVEYGLRCKPGFITMNGICVWHLGFTGKSNIGMDHYQVDRNELIMRSVSGVIEDTNPLRKAIIDFRNHLLRFDYDSAEICVKAIEDYLKGPDFLAEDHGFEILSSNNKLAHKMTSILDMDYDLTRLDYRNPYTGLPYSRLKHFLYRLTYNGHRFWPFKYNEELICVPYTPDYTPSRIAFREKLFAINPENLKGFELNRDNKRYKTLKKRFNKAMMNYRLYHSEVERKYAEAKQMFISERFWKKYLQIDKADSE